MLLKDLLNRFRRQPRAAAASLDDVKVRVFASRNEAGEEVVWNIRAADGSKLPNDIRARMLAQLHDGRPVSG